MIRRPPRSTRTDTLFPYTTLFRSAQWLIATAKRSNRLRVFDGESGEPLRTVGGPGVRPGEFSYPNGISVIDALLLVVERDNHRVQVLRLPDFLPLATFGEHDLRSEEHKSELQSLMRISYAVV